MNRINGSIGLWNGMSCCRDSISPLTITTLPQYKYFSKLVLSTPSKIISAPSKFYKKDLFWDNLLNLRPSKKFSHPLTSFLYLNIINILIIVCRCVSLYILSLCTELCFVTVFFYFTNNLTVNCHNCK